MPEPYGHKFKYELRQEIQQLTNELRNEEIGHAKTKIAYNRAISKIVELEANIAELEAKIQRI